MSSILVTGFDPGFANLGWSRCAWDGTDLSIVAGGVLHTQPSQKKRRVRAVDDAVRRIRELVHDLAPIVRSSHVVTMESLAHAKGGTKQIATKQGMAIGAIVTLCDVFNKPLLQSTPQEIKKLLCGSMKASKEDVRASLLRNYPAFKSVLDKLAEQKKEHCADSLGSIVAGIRTEEVRLCLSAIDSQAGT